MTLQTPRVDERTASTPTRLWSVDALRAFLVAWIIAGHALLGYSAVGGWVYAHFTEVRFVPRVEWALAALIGTTGVFLTGTFFLIAGMFTAVSFARRGAREFLLRRLVRLGVPFAATVLVIWPAVEWLGLRTRGRSPGYVELVTGHRVLDAGAMWFVGVLLLFSVGYLLWHRIFRAPGGGLELRGRHLVLLATGIAVASFTLRLWLPAHGQGLPDPLHLWDWPQLLPMFALGAAMGLPMATRIPDWAVRRCGIVTLATVCSVPALALLLGADNVAEAAPLFLGGWHWQAALLALVQGILVVAGSVSILGLAQRHVDGSGPLARGAARASYAAFVLQNPILMVAALALRPMAAPAEVKAPLVAVVAVAGCFLLGHVLATHSPVRRILQTS